MSIFSYLVLLLLIYPIIINKISQLQPRIKSSPFLFIAPALLLGLSILSFVQKSPIELVLWNVSSYFSLGYKLDVLSGLIATTVLTIGIAVSRFCVRYLEDDMNKKIFSEHLSYTLTGVLSMLMAPNLVLFFFSWVGASYFLHKLLTHFADRPEAQKAARQKFLVSRLGDLFIFSAGGILLWTCNTLNFDLIFQTIQTPGFLEDNYFSIHVVSVLLVLGAMTKSAQFPFHYWLPNTMETPTPVSAIMHAGIINAGGYLVIRMSPLLSSAPLSLSILAVVGGLTAFWATLIMFSQNNVKKSLAYSTIAQMGFMMLQCGLGAFSIAVVHLIGHAFYKAYAFLSSGTATDFGRLNRYFPKPKESQSLTDALFLGAICLMFIFGGAIFFGLRPQLQPGVSVLLVVLSLAASQIIMSSKDKLISIVTAGAVVLFYFLLTGGMSVLLFDIAPHQTFSDGKLGQFTLFVCIGFFVVLYMIQNSLPRISKSEMGKKLYVRALNGVVR